MTGQCRDTGTILQHLTGAIQQCITTKYLPQLFFILTGHTFTETPETV